MDFECYVKESLEDVKKSGRRIEDKVDRLTDKYADVKETLGATKVYSKFVWLGVTILIGLGIKVLIG